MAQKTVWLPEVGELILSKRKGTKNIRLSISPAGKVRVGLPPWAPYSMGINFAQSRAEWINKHKGAKPKLPLEHGVRIGKSYRLEYMFDPVSQKTSARLQGLAIKVTSSLPFSDPTVQKQAVSAAERALKKEAKLLLPKKLAELAKRNNLVYRAVRIKKLSSRWGSCTHDKTITLNYFLMQLPWHLIDYVLVHELIHTKHLNHSRDFWQDFEKIYPNAKKVRREIKYYRPIINSPAVIVA
jgi:predicted metal-dependent hydrolase